MKVYLCFPISGVEDPFEPAHAAKADLEARGFEVISPAELDEAEGIDSKTAGRGVGGSREWARFLARDLPLICAEDVEAVVVLPGWESSQGCTLEVHVAGELGKQILRYPDLGPARHPGSQRFHKILRELGTLHDRKQADYGTDADPFANVRNSSEWGMPAWVGAMMRGTDKVNRLKTFARRGTLANEGVLDAFSDLAVYAVIARVLFEEEADPEPSAT